MAAVTGVLAAHDGFILDSQQFADLETGRFFMRLVFAAAGPRFPGDPEALHALLAPVADRFGFDWTLCAANARPRVLIAVSRQLHCLHDLLYRWASGMLPVEVVAVAGNHPDGAMLAAQHGLPFHQLPMAPGAREGREAALEALLAETRAELLVLARYMQILSPAFVSRHPGRILNIHHSFLPSFVGARPYHQAHARGVKLIGATAHFVTAELDAGPIIEQDVERVDHRAAVADLVAIGRDIEARVLARALASVAERRVFVNNGRTVVFR